MKSISSSASSSQRARINSARVSSATGGIVLVGRGDEESSVPLEQAPPGSLGDDATNDKAAPKRWDRRVLWGSGLLLLSVVVLAVMIATASSREDHATASTADPVPTTSPVRRVEPTGAPTLHPTPHPTSLARFFDFATFVADDASLSSRDSIEDLATPQSRAIQWLAHRDLRFLDPLDPAQRAEIIDRYLMVLLYFSLEAQDAVLLSTSGSTTSQRHPIRDVFLDANHICDWNYDRENGESRRGIFCIDNDAEGSEPRVTQIILRGIVLGGRIPDEIGFFSDLQVLDLSRNEKLHGTIPESIGDCTDLMEIGINANEMDGTIPSSLSNLTRLVSLLVGGNKLSGNVPSELSALSDNLTLLRAEQNSLEGELPSALGSLTQLTELQLSQNLFSSTIPTTIGLLTDLKILELSNNNLDGTIPLELASLSQLENIDMRLNLFSGNIPDFASWTNLVDFDFRFNSFEGSLDRVCEANIAQLENACADCRTSNMVQCTCCQEFGCCT